jgi:hypothetical protein
MGQPNSLINPVEKTPQNGSEAIQMRFEKCNIIVSKTKESMGFVIETD